jgi:hypothetical protein
MRSASVILRVASGADEEPAALRFAAMSGYFES